MAGLTLEPRATGRTTSRDCILLNDNTQHQLQRGVARYFDKITDGLIEYFGGRILVCSSHQRNYGPARHFNPDAQRFLRLFFRRSALRWLLARCTCPKLIYSPYYGFLNARSPLIFTVHDMIPERIPAHLGERFLAEKQRCLERAAALIAVSQATAKELQTVYPHITPEKTHVIHLGVDEFFFHPSLPSLQAAVPRPYFLYVGHRGAYKNFLRLLLAFGRSGLAPGCELRVVCPLAQPLTQSEAEVLDRYGLRQSVHLLLNPGDEKLRQLYADALAFIYPSEMEGFGLPLLEAMASGTLVAASNTSVMSEVGGEVPVYFDPRDVDSMVDSLQSLAQISPGQRAERISHGVRRARLFRWEECQRKTVALFMSVLQQAGGRALEPTRPSRHSRTLYFSQRGLPRAVMPLS